MLKTALIGAIVTLIVLILPLKAQDRLSVLELLANDTDARFGLFLAALEAAGLTDEIAALENATLLVPTDEAMINAMNDLGISRQGFFADSAALSEILAMHIVPERLFFRDLSGGVSVDSVGGEPVDFTLYRGMLWADNARISDVDNLAASGVIVHAVDDVILPEAMREHSNANRAYLRVAHLLPDYAPVALYLNGNPSGLQGLGFGEISQWMDIAAGDQLLSVATSGSDTASAELNLNIEPESWVTLAIVGENDGQQAKLVPLIEDYDPLALGQARLSFFNGIEGSIGLDLIANGQLFLGGIAFPGLAGENDGFSVLPLPVATYDFLITAAGNPEVVVLNVPDIRLRDGYNVFLAASGTPVNPQVILLETNVNVERAFAEERRSP